jgi:hypothetical protein
LDRSCEADRPADYRPGVITKYFTWRDSASPWSDSDMNKNLMSYATELITARLVFVQKLSHAKNLEDLVKIQSEFLKTQTDSFNETAKELGEMRSKGAKAAIKTLTMSA